MAGESTSLYYMLIQALPYITVTIVIHKIVGLLVNRRFLSHRIILANKQRQIYFEKLTSLSAQIEAESAKEDAKLAKRIEEMERQFADLRSQLYDTFDSDETLERLQEQLNSLERSKQELTKYQFDLSELDIRENIDEKIKEIQVNNQFLESATGDRITYSTVRGQDAEILEFLTLHNDDLHMNHLVKMYDTLLALKATESLDEVETFGQSDHVQHINNLLIEKKKTEMDLQKMYEQYQREVDLLRDARINFILQVDSAKAQIDNLKYLNQITEELIELRRGASPVMNGNERLDAESITAKDYNQLSSQIHV